MSDQAQLVEAIQATLETADSALRARPTMRRWRDGEHQIRIAAKAIAQARALVVAFGQLPDPFQEVR